MTGLAGAARRPRQDGPKTADSVAVTDPVFGLTTASPDRIRRRTRVTSWDGITAGARSVGLRGRHAAARSSPEAIAAAGTPQMRRFKTAMKQATVLSR